MIVTCDAPWLSADFGQERDIISWAPYRGGLVRAGRVLWRGVRNADLPPGLDVADWLRAELSGYGAQDAVCFLTSRDVRAHHHSRHVAEGIVAEALVTAGLSNAEAIGTRQGPDAPFGTINIAVEVGAPLTLPARIEALSIAAEARTAAVIGAAVRLPTGIATGTGTDCIALASGGSGVPLDYAGLHTAVGEAVGGAVYRAVTAAVAEWIDDWRGLGRIAADGSLIWKA